MRTSQVSKSGKAVSKAGQYVKKVHGATCHRDITQEKEVQFSSFELQSHIQRATKRWFLDEIKAEARSRRPHDNPDAFKRVCFALIIMLRDRTIPRQSPSHRKRPYFSGDRELSFQVPFNVSTCTSTYTSCNVFSSFCATLTASENSLAHQQEVPA